MGSILERIRSKAEALANEGAELIQQLEEHGWKDKRPARTKAQTKKLDLDADLRKILREQHVPATVRVPGDYVHRYEKWFASCLALVEANMRSRAAELAELHRGLSAQLHTALTETQQHGIADRISQMAAVVSSIPGYLEGRAHDIELGVAQAYVQDQLAEALVLHKAGHVRAAGAIAGVLLERHLKLLCTKQQPPLSFPKTRATISILNEVLKGAQVYDVAQWRKVQWMGDVRNTCDHAGSSEPRPEDVGDLVAEVKKFVALFAV